MENVITKATATEMINLNTLMCLKMNKRVYQVI